MVIRKVIFSSFSDARELFCAVALKLTCAGLCANFHQLISSFFLQCQPTKGTTRIPELPPRLVGENSYQLVGHTGQTEEEIWCVITTLKLYLNWRIFSDVCSFLRPKAILSPQVQVFVHLHTMGANPLQPPNNPLTIFGIFTFGYKVDV